MGKYSCDSTFEKMKIFIKMIEQIKIYIMDSLLLLGIAGSIVTLTLLVGIFKFKKFKAYVKFSWFGFGFEGEK